MLPKIKLSQKLSDNHLDYLIEIVESEIFGSQMYPEIYHKAGLYMYNIIANHIFQGGNKRTGLESALLFLQLNNYDLKQSGVHNKLSFFQLVVCYLIHKQGFNPVFIFFCATICYAPITKVRHSKLSFFDLKLKMEQKSENTTLLSKKLKFFLKI